jgi:hypothetical protein
MIASDPSATLVSVLLAMNSSLTNWASWRQPFALVQQLVDQEA